MKVEGLHESSVPGPDIETMNTEMIKAEIERLYASNNTVDKKVSSTPPSMSTEQSPSQLHYLDDEEE